MDNHKVILKADGTIIRKFKNKLHSESDIPAIDSKEIKIWYNDGIIHRNSTDIRGNILPAIIYNDGGKEWWINGKRLNK